MADWGEYKEIDLNPEEAEEVYNFYMYGDVTAYKGREEWKIKTNLYFIMVFLVV